MPIADHVWVTCALDLSRQCFRVSLDLHLAAHTNFRSVSMRRPNFPRSCSQTAETPRNAFDTPSMHTIAFAMYFNRGGGQLASWSGLHAKQKVYASVQLNLEVPPAHVAPTCWLIREHLNALRGVHAGPEYRYVRAQLAAAATCLSMQPAGEQSADTAAPPSVLRAHTAAREAADCSTSRHNGCQGGPLVEAFQLPVL